MKFLKALVIGMGVLIIAGVIAVGYGLYRQVSGTAKTAEQPLASQPEQSAVTRAPFGTQEIALEKDERIVEISYPDGRAAVRIAAGDGSERIVLFDLATGQQLGSIRFTPRL
tara:strand:+ start:1535 stop:1870 length:336 start_codon:yes stop_codon:yes gene_type:complete